MFFTMLGLELCINYTHRTNCKGIEFYLLTMCITVYMYVTIHVDGRGYFVESRDCNIFYIEDLPGGLLMMMTQEYQKFRRYKDNLMS